MYHILYSWNFPILPPDVGGKNFICECLSRVNVEDMAIFTAFIPLNVFAIQRQLGLAKFLSIEIFRLYSIQFTIQTCLR